MKKLYIIGNGFDIHHGLKTSYYAFAEYLKEKDRDLYDLLEKFISLPEDEDDLWAKFEENLAYLDASEILSDNADYLPNISSEDFRDRDWHTFESVVTDIKDLLTDGLLNQFRNFILKVKIPVDILESKVQLENDALYLNFNYTETLESVYGIPKDSINYIHHCANSDCEYIILGHGIDPKEFEEVLPEPPEDLDPEYLQDWYEEHQSYDYPYDSGKDSLMKFFTDMHKPTEKIIADNENFFSKLTDVETIFVFGHSMSPVDLPYFEKIFDSTKKDTKWIVSYYSNESIEGYKKVLNKIGVEESNYELIKLSSIQVNNNQLEIDFHSGNQ
ncbi:bacteriophage abortive infection AbiH family protein [Flavobacterium rhizosphaerae]|uniref:Bacteriophage abortive infection AbiH family protein n=1 Tax=Flavobacterium rhizosphaerae TaxID=3163298 RepID=A0ABW8YVF3_9FLAO